MMFKEHTDGKHPKLSIMAHTSTTLADMKVLVKEDSDAKRKVKEAFTMHKMPPVNRD